MMNINSLRNLKKRKVDVRKAILAKIVASKAKQSGQAKDIDEEYGHMHLSKKDVPRLVAFLNLLNDVPDKEFKNLILKVKEDYDGAEPSGNSVASLALLKLAAITGNTRYREVADKTLSYFSGRMKTVSVGVPYMLRAADFALREPNRVVIAGDRKSAAARPLLGAVHYIMLVKGFQIRPLIFLAVILILLLLRLRPGRLAMRFQRG